MLGNNGDASSDNYVDHSLSESGNSILAEQLPNLCLQAA